MTNVKYRALLGKRFKDLNDLIYQNASERYFYAMEVASFLHNAVAPEDDILVGMMLAADLAQWTGLSDELNARVLRIAEARATDTALSTEDAGVLAALTIVELRSAIHEYERADKGWLRRESFKDNEPQGEAFEVLGAIYLQVKNHSFGNVLKVLIHRAMEISEMEAVVFIDERPVYEITMKNGLDVPKWLLKMVEKLSFSYCLEGKRLYVSGRGMEARRTVPAWAALMAAHRQELLIVKSARCYSELNWSYHRIESWMDAVCRSWMQAPLVRAVAHRVGEPLDCYCLLIEHLKSFH